MISAYGVTRNPVDPSRIAGGSSSGSAAAVGAGMCCAAIGTDTAGSIRLPASFCGVVGLKPTHGLVSAEGVVPLAETYDHVGPITRTVADAENVLRTLVPDLGPAPEPPFRIGVARRYFFEGLDTEVATIVEDAIARLAQSTGVIREIDLPVDEDRTAQMYESYRYHSAFLAAKSALYDPQTLARVLRGKDVSAEQYATALEATHRIRQEVAHLFESVELIITPTVPILPPAVHELDSNLDTLRARELLMLRNTRPFNVLGLPTATVTCGYSGKGLPVGLQFAAAAGRDLTALAGARLVLTER